MEEQVSQLPHLVVDEPKRSKWAVAGIFVLSFMVLSIPLGLYLVGKQTQITPQAAVFEKVPELSTGIVLESKLSPEIKMGIIPVDVYVKSSIDPVNLVNAQIKFDPGLISIDKIATDAASVKETVTFNKWIEVRTDNNLGNAAIIAGLPSPGVVSLGQNNERIYLATLHVRPKSAGTAVIQITGGSQLLRNSDNLNIFQTGSDLVLGLSGAVNEASSAAISGNKPQSRGSSQPLIVLTSPVTAGNYSYFRPLDILWSSFNVDRIAQINLVINGEKFGPVAQNLEGKEGKFTWLPKDSLALPYVQLANTFQIEIVGVSKDGEAAKIISGPFGILGVDEVAGSPPNPEAFFQNQLSLDDASRLLSDYLVLPLEDKALDFNRDDVINELDFYLLRQNLLQRGIIR